MATEDGPAPSEDAVTRVTRREPTGPGSGGGVSPLLQSLSESQAPTIRASTLTPVELGEMRAAAEQGDEDALLEGRRKAILTAISPVAGAAVFAWQRSSPRDPIQLLADLESKSPALAAALTNGRPTVVEFYAKWCGDCKAMAPEMHELVRAFGAGAGGAQVNFVVLDADKDANEPLVNALRVDAIPHFAFVDTSQQIRTTLTGYVPRKVMEKQLQSLAAGQPLPYCGPDACQIKGKFGFKEKVRG